MIVKSLQEIRGIVAIGENTPKKRKAREVLNGTNDAIVYTTKKNTITERIATKSEIVQETATTKKNLLTSTEMMIEESADDLINYLKALNSH